MQPVSYSNYVNPNLSLKQIIPAMPPLESKETDKISTEIDFKDKINGFKLSGKIKDTEFSLSKSSALLNWEQLKGEINGQKVNLTMKSTLFDGYTLSGTIGDKKVNIKFKNTLMNGRKITGEFGEENINLSLTKETWGFNKNIIGSGLNLKFQKAGIINKKIDLNGTCTKNSDLIPLILALEITKNKYEEQELIYAAAATNMI